MSAPKKPEEDRHVVRSVSMPPGMWERTKAAAGNLPVSRWWVEAAEEKMTGDSVVMRGLLRRMLAANPPEVVGPDSEMHEPLAFFPGTGEYASQLTHEEAALIAELGSEIEAVRGYFRPAVDRPAPIEPVGESERMPDEMWAAVVASQPPRQIERGPVEFVPPPPIGPARQPIRSFDPDEETPG